MTASDLKSKRQHLRFVAENRPQYAQRQPADEVELRLPVPPSTNRLYRNKRGGPGRVKTQTYRDWRSAAELLGNIQKPKRRDGLSDVTIYAPPGRADRDNIIKPALDACVAIGVIADDNPRYIRNVSLIVDSSRTDCLLVFRPTTDFPQPF